MEVLDDPRLNRIFQLTRRATEPWPLPRVLKRLCEEVAALLPADIVSVYLREELELIMRANVGFPEEAIGNVALSIGEGITGFAAECMKPVRREQASADDHFKPVDGLDERRFPIFLAWPLLRHEDVVGVLVLQRERDPFADDELQWVGAASSAFVLACEAAAHRHTQAARHRGELEGREARLHGRGVVPGLSVGRAELLPSLRALVGELDADAFTPTTLQDVKRQLERGVAKLTLSDEARQRLDAVRLVLEDARFGAELDKEIGQRGLAEGLTSIARRYALTALRTRGADDWLHDRASEVSALCRLIAAHLAQRPLCRPGGVLVLPSRPGSLLALEAAMRRACGVVVGDELPSDSIAARVLVDAGIATVAQVAGLFDWVRTGDPVLVDGDAGVLWVNPSEAQIARTRA